MDWKSVRFDWNRVRAFVVAAEEGSLSAAARALKLAQPTVGRQIAALEEELGVTLFERVGKGIELTDGGAHLLDHARAMGEAASRLSVAASGQAQSLEGLVCISAGELDAFFRLPPLLSKIQQKQPLIELDILSTNELSDLKRREADIALRNVRPEQEDLIARKVSQERIWLYGSPERVKDLPESPKHEGFAQVKLLGFDRDQRMVGWLEQRGWRLGPRSFPFTSQSQLLQWQMAKRGGGLLFLPEDIGDSEGSLRRAFEHLGPIEVLPLWLVSHRELRTNPRVRYVFDAMVEYYMSRDHRLQAPEEPSEE